MVLSYRVPNFHFMILSLAIECAVATPCKFELVTDCYNPSLHLNVESLIFFW